MMYDFKPGDTITLEHPDGSRLVGRTVTPSGESVSHRVGAELGTGVEIAALVRQGWTITDHKPKVVLPTERGHYVDERGDLWNYDGDNFWSNLYSGSDYPIHGVEPIAPYLLERTFTRLIPEGSEREQAFAEVAEWLESEQYSGIAREVRERFGVAP